MIKKLILAIACFGLAMSIPLDSVGQSGSTGRSTSAIIKATARVVPTAGMTEATRSTIALIPDYEPFASGSHLFWLYYPKPGQVQIDVSRSGGLSPVIYNDNLDTEQLRRLIEYPYASLIELPDLPVTGDPITITLIYTDN